MIHAQFSPTIELRVMVVLSARLGRLWLAGRKLPQQLDRPTVHQVLLQQQSQ
jgi:hypothetical protein